MSLFSRLFGGDKSKLENNNSKSESAVSLQGTSTDAVNDSQIVAVVMAALMNILSEEGGELRIKSIRRTGRSSPVWNVAGREDYIAAKF